MIFKSDKVKPFTKKEAIDLMVSLSATDANSENWWRLKYKDEIAKYDISILQQRIFKNTDFQLEIDGEFEREKLKFNKDTMRVEYDGKDFELSKRWETSGGSKNFDVHVRVKDKKDVDWIPDRDMKP